MPLKDREALRKYQREWERRKRADLDFRKVYNERKARERRERRKAHPEKFKISDRRDWLRKAYGVTPEWYDTKLAEQNNACAICGKSKDRIHHRSGKEQRLAVDHDHATGEPRGLLCEFCNHRLYLIEYPHLFMTNALAYLRRYGRDIVSAG